MYVILPSNATEDLSLAPFPVIVNNFHIILQILIIVCTIEKRAKKKRRRKRIITSSYKSRIYLFLKSLLYIAVVKIRIRKELRQQICILRKNFKVDVFTTCKSSL